MRHLVQSAATDIRRDAYKSRKFAFPLPSLPHKSAKMLPIRTPLGSISSNRLKGLEISPYIRGQVKGQAKRGITQGEIARDLKLTSSIV
jgi:hypothetical protein